LKYDAAAVQTVVFVYYNSFRCFLLTEQFASELVIQTILFEGDKHLEIDKNEEILDLVIFQHLKKIKEI
jgi:hypothetical protein